MPPLLTLRLLVTDKVVHFHQPVTTVGSHPSSTFVIADNGGVSPHHATLFWGKDGSIEVGDLIYFGVVGFRVNNRLSPVAGKDHSGETPRR